MSAVGILQVSHDHTGAVVVNILKRLVWKINEGDIAQGPSKPVKYDEWLRREVV
jgi:hypothetical protein